MKIADDIHSVEELNRDAEQLVREARRTRRPMVITLDGKPAALLISTELFPSKQTGLDAACELATAVV